MNEMSHFAVMQVLASAVIVGPILAVIGLLNKHNKRRSSAYLTVGLFLTMVGAFFLHRAFNPSHATESVKSEMGASK